MNLAELQSRMAGAIMRPLTDSRKLRSAARELIRPNDRLTSWQRLEIYGKSYWFRILDGLYDDFPGLVAVLGKRAFHRMAQAYLTECPSQSYTMRNLGSRLPAWLQANPQFAGRVHDLAVDMARLEWAHVEAFDGPESPPLGPEDLLEPGPDLRLALQPHLTLLALRYPVDDFRIEAAEPSAASNTVGAPKRHSLLRRFRRTRPQPVFLSVYRREESVYYRRLDCDEFLVLEALRAGQSIGDALEICLEDSIPQVELWFARWSELGWLCHA